MELRDVEQTKAYVINGRNLVVIDNRNYLSEPYLLLQGETGGVLKMYYRDIETIKEAKQ